MSIKEYPIIEEFPVIEEVAERTPSWIAEGLKGTLADILSPIWGLAGQDMPGAEAGRLGLGRKIKEYVYGPETQFDEQGQPLPSGPTPAMSAIETAAPIALAGYGLSQLPSLLRTQAAIYPGGRVSQAMDYLTKTGKGIGEQLAFRPYTPPPYIKEPLYSPEEVATAQKVPIGWVPQARQGMGWLANMLRPQAVGVEAPITPPSTPSPTGTSLIPYRPSIIELPEQPFPSLVPSAPAKVYATYRVLNQKGEEIQKGTALLSPTRVEELSKRPNVEILNVTDYRPPVQEVKVKEPAVLGEPAYKPFYITEVNPETNEVIHQPLTIKSDKITSELTKGAIVDHPSEISIMNDLDIKEIPKQAQPIMTQPYRVTFVNLNGEVENKVQAGSTILNNLLKGQRYIQLIPTKLPPPRPPVPTKALPAPAPVLLLPRGTVTSYFGIKDVLSIPKHVNYQARRLLDEAKIFFGKNREAIVTRAGEPGEKLIHEIKKATIIPYLKSGDFNNEMNLTVIKYKGFSKPEWQNLQDVLQGRARPINQKVTDMFMVMDRQRKTIESLRRSQDPSFAGLTNYYHHDIPAIKELKNPTVRAEIVEDMVRRRAVPNFHEGELMIGEWIEKVENERAPTSIYNYLIRKGYAKDESDAAYILNNFIKRYRGFKYGAFEPRTVDLPFYKPNPLQVVPEYNEMALRHLYNAERFGENAEKLQGLVDKIAETGTGRETAETIVKLFTGASDLSSTRHLTRLALDSQVIQRMSLSPVGNFFQGLTGSATRTNLWTTFKSLGDKQQNLFAAHQFAARAGQHPEFKTFFSEGAGGIARKFLKKTGFTKTEVDNYVTGVWAGKSYALDQFVALQKNPRNTKVRDNLIKMGIDPIQSIRRGYLTDTDLRTAGIIVWREGQAIPQIWNQPQRWLGAPLTSDLGRLAFQFKSVAFPQVSLIWNYGVKQAMKGNWSALLTLMLLYPAVGEIIEDIQDTIAGRGRPKNLFIRYLDDLQGSFAWGILDDIFYLAQSGLSYGLGPGMQQVGEILQGTIQLMKGKSPTGLKRQLRGIPYVGQVMYEAVKEKKGEGRTLRSPHKPR